MVSKEGQPVTLTLGSIENLIGRSRDLLTEKELSFLESIRVRLEKDEVASHGQQRWYHDLEFKYSVENVAEEAKWKEGFDYVKRKIAMQVALYYYANPPYFSNYVQKIFANPNGFVLSRKEWNKLCENKYALKIRNMYETPLRFSVGDCIQIRKTNKISRSNYPVGLPSISEKVGFVIKADAAPVTRAAKGSRVYEVLLAGSMAPLRVHESDIKRGKKNHGKKN